MSKPMTDPKSHGSHELHESPDPDLVDRLVAYVVRLEPALADRQFDIEQDIRAEYGGDRWYIQARTQTQRQARVREVLQRFNGRNASEVARELRISRATVYRILKQPGRAPSPGADACEASPRVPYRRATPGAATPPVAAQPRKPPPAVAAAGRAAEPARLSQPVPTAETAAAVG